MRCGYEIDADKFKDCFNTDTAIGKTMRLMIDEQPTAYFDKGIDKGIDKAIEIVKSGGVADEK